MIFCRAVCTTIVDPYYNRTVIPGRRQPIERLIDLPLPSIGGRAVKQVLAILHIDHPIAVARALIIWRQIEPNPPHAPQTRHGHSLIQDRHIGASSAV
jgi:hypothetical protein